MAKKMGDRTTRSVPKPETQSMFNARIPSSLHEAVRDAAYWSRWTTADIVRLGLQMAVEKLMAEHNGGKPFDPRPEELPKSKHRQRK